MQIYVKTLTGKTIIVNYEDTDTILKIKQNIKEKTGIEINQQRLVYCGKMLVDRELAGTYQLHKEGLCHLVLKIDAPYHPDFNEKFESDDIELLWTVNYLDESNSAFPSQTMTILATDNLVTALASYKQRSAEAHAKQATYLSLTAIRKRDREAAFREVAPHKYQPVNAGTMYHYISLNEEMPIRHLLVALPNDKETNDKFQIIQAPDKAIHFSLKYQTKLRELIANLHFNAPPPPSIFKSVTAQNVFQSPTIPKPVNYAPQAPNIPQFVTPQVNAPQAPTTPKPVTSQVNTSQSPNVPEPIIIEINLDNPIFTTLKDLIDNEIEFNIPDDKNEKEMVELEKSLNECLKQLAEAKTLPLVVSKQPNLINTILTHVNDSRRTVNSIVTDEDIFKFGTLVLNHHKTELFPSTTNANPGVVPNNNSTNSSSSSMSNTNTTTTVPKAPYLMFDLGGVLEGDVVMDNYPKTSNDIIIEEHDWGGYTVLKNGVQIIKDINELVTRFGYKLAFHSNDIEADQLKRLDLLKKAWESQNLNFPGIAAMAVYDNKQLGNISYQTPVKSYNAKHNIMLASWGLEADHGKATLRRVLENLLAITPEIRSKSVIFDDAPSCEIVAKNEGYNACLIQGANSLDVAVRAVLNHVRQQVKTPTVTTTNTSSNVSNQTTTLTTFKDPLAYENLSPDFKATLSVESKPERQKKGGISTDVYWNQCLTREQKQVKLAMFNPTVIPARSEIGFFEQNNNSYKNQNQLEFRQFLSSHTEETRQIFGGISPSEYWSQTDPNEQTRLIKQYEKETGQQFNAGDKMQF